MRYISTYIIGLIFGLGISLSGMSNPAKVINFFDVAGSWDPSLAFVMGGALLVTFIGYRLVLPRPSGPIFEGKFALPTATKLDARLLGGSALFGVGPRQGKSLQYPNPPQTRLSHPRGARLICLRLVGQIYPQK